MSALHSLQIVSNKLFNTQQQVSSGLRISKAADNAAYWSIATTMKSDKGAVSAVSDALGLGAATVDTAYEGLDSTINVLSQFKNKLVTATEGSVDKDKVQQELEQLKQQITSIASSSSFNGVNWLSTNIDDLNDSEQNKTSVMSSFARSANGDVGVTMSSVDLSKISLLNSTGSGLLQADSSIDTTMLGGLGSNPPSDYGYYQASFSFGGSKTFSASDQVSFDLTLDSGGSSPGLTYSVTIDQALINSALGVTTGTISDAAQMDTVLNKAFQNASIPAGVGASGQRQPDGSTIWYAYNISVDGIPGQTESNLQIGNISSTLAGGAALGLDSTPSVFRRDYASTEMNFTGPFQFDDDSSISFDLQLDGASQLVTLTKADAIAALGSRTVTSSSDMATLLSSKLSGAGLLFTASSGTSVHIAVDPSVLPAKGNNSSFWVSNVTGSVVGIRPNLTDIDVTDGSSISSYLNDVESMLQKVTSAASSVGSLRSRIDTQTDFATSLNDSLTRGIGQLVDADMESASAKLAAEQTQQQLAVQALSIANQAPQTMLSLFR